MKGDLVGRVFFLDKPQFVKVNKLTVKRCSNSPVIREIKSERYQYSYIKVTIKLIMTNIGKAMEK